MLRNHEKTWTRKAYENKIISGFFNFQYSVFSGIKAIEIKGGNQVDFGKQINYKKSAVYI